MSIAPRAAVVITSLLCMFLQQLLGFQLQTASHGPTRQQLPSGPRSPNERAELVIELEQWCKSSGFFPSSTLGKNTPALCIKDAGPGRGFGLYAARAIEADEVLALVPPELTLAGGPWPDALPESLRGHPAVGAAAAALWPRRLASEERARGPGELPPAVLVALQLLHHRALGPRSAFDPYLRSLPKSFDELPLFWGEAELRMLEGTLVHQDTVLLRERLRVEHAVLRPALPPGGASFEDWQWARAAVLSRAYKVAGTYRLIPLLDMGNHDDSTPYAVLGSEGEHFPEGTSIFVAAKSYNKGDEVFSRYGNLRTWQKLFSFGYTPLAPLTTTATSAANARKEWRRSGVEDLLGGSAAWAAPLDGAVDLSPEMAEKTGGRFSFNCQSNVHQEISTKVMPSLRNRKLHLAYQSLIEDKLFVGASFSEHFHSLFEEAVVNSTSFQDFLSICWSMPAGNFFSPRDDKKIEMLAARSIMFLKTVSSIDETGPGQSFDDFEEWLENVVLLVEKENDHHAKQLLHYLLEDDDKAASIPSFVNICEARLCVLSQSLLRIYNNYLSTLNRDTVQSLASKGASHWTMNWQHSDQDSNHNIDVLNNNNNNNNEVGTSNEACGKPSGSKNSIDNGDGGEEERQYKTCFCHSSSSNNNELHTSSSPQQKQDEVYVNNEGLIIKCMHSVNVIVGEFFVLRGILEKVIAAEAEASWHSSSSSSTSISFSNYDVAAS